MQSNRRIGYGLRSICDHRTISARDAIDKQKEIAAQRDDPLQSGTGHA
jgi:hypothetical protein